MAVFYSFGMLQRRFLINTAHNTYMGAFPDIFIRNGKIVGS
jgi:hypothetical protein